MPKLPRLNDLIRLANAAANAPDGIFQCDHRNIGIEQQLYKLQSVFSQSSPSGLSFVPMQPTGRQIRTRRVGNHKIPAAAEHVSHVALVMEAGRFGGQEIARHGVVPVRDESIAHGSTKLTSYQYVHHAPLAAVPTTKATISTADTNHTATIATSSTSLIICLRFIPTPFPL